MKGHFFFLMTLVAAVFSLSNCASQNERKVVLPESEQSSLPWNTMQAGEGQGMLGGFQRR